MKKLYAVLSLIALAVGSLLLLGEFSDADLVRFYGWMIVSAIYGCAATILKELDRSKR